jgi:hypothetical protein
MGLTPINIALFNTKQLYLWVLLGQAFVTSGVSGGARGIYYAQQLTYLLAFMMVLHCFMAGILSFSVFAATSTRTGLLRVSCQVSTAMGLVFFGWATFLCQNGTRMNDVAAGFATAATFFLLVPELLADCFLLTRFGGAEELVSEPREASVRSDLAGPLLPARDQLTYRMRDSDNEPSCGCGKGFGGYCIIVICLASVAAWQLAEVSESFPRDS